MELLIKKAQKGEKEAFIQAINVYMGQLYKVAKSKLASESDIGDAIQDTILSAYKSIPNLKEPKYFNTWITRILINKCNNIISKNNKITYIEDYSQVNCSENMETRSENIEERLDFEKTLEVLNEDYRIVVVLYYVNGFTTKEISEVLNEKEGTIKSRLSRARQQLKEYYSNIYPYNRLPECEIGGTR